MNKSVEALNAPEYVVFDTETTALKAALAYGKIIEIGAVKIRGDKIVDRFSSFINPEMKIPKKITELTHITDDDVKDAETIYPVLRKFKEFCGNAVLVAHNAPFDVRYLKFFTNQICMPFDTHTIVVDTCKLDKVLFPDAPNHKLCTIAERFGIVQESAHRAIDDAYVTGLIFIKMREILKDKLQNVKYTYECSKKVVNVDLLKIRRVSDFIVPAKKNKPAIDRLYVTIYYPCDNVYGSIYYDRTRKEWYNKDFPEGYELDFEKVEKEVLIIRKGVL